MANSDSPNKSNWPTSIPQQYSPPELSPHLAILRFRLGHTSVKHPSLRIRLSIVKPGVLVQILLEWFREGFEGFALGDGSGNVSRGRFGGFGEED
jgi:hypothetical protein